MVENGTPQGSVISPLLFNIMSNDVFSNVQPGIERLLFADNGSLWKRGENVEYALKKVQENLTLVEDWGRKWGFRFSIEKTKAMFFTQKKIDENIKLELYGRNLERVKSFKFLAVFFDTRLTWRDHLSIVVDKCKKSNEFNEMSCWNCMGSRCSFFEANLCIFNESKN